MGGRTLLGLASGGGEERVACCSSLELWVSAPYGILKNTEYIKARGEGKSSWWRQQSKQKMEF